MAIAAAAPPPRPYLSVPADRPERHAKALASGADAVIVDLEAAVAPDAEDAGRAGLRAWLASADARGVAVRVNAVGTPCSEADLRAWRARRRLPP